MNIIDLNNNKHAKKNFPNLFSVYKIKNKVLPNRLVFPSWGLNFCTKDGDFTNKLIEFYEDLAFGGCGLIITGAAAISKSCICPGLDFYMRIYDDKWIKSYKILFDKIKSHGALVGIQLAHPGRQHPYPPYGHETLIAPSAIPIPQLIKKNPEYKVRAMTQNEIRQCIKDFVDSAERSFKAGVDYIEFHGANGFLITQFLSPRSNIRNDKYGGSIANRTRFLEEIIRETKKIVGNNVLIGARLTISEYIDGGLTPEHYEIICPILEDAGLDIINGSVGTTRENLDINIPIAIKGEMPNVDTIAEVKKYTKLPIVNVGSIISCKNAEKLIKEKKADLVAFGRSQMADSNFIKLSAKGDEDKIRQCLRCNYCIRTKREDFVYCMVNPKYKKRVDETEL